MLLGCYEFPMHATFLVFHACCLFYLFSFDRSEVFDEETYNEWANLADAPAISASLILYNELKRLGFKLILLTGRTEVQRNATAKNLLLAGYDGWERLILRYMSFFLHVLLLPTCQL